MNERRAAVVGGGLLGATLALRLAEAGREVTLYEASSDLGGLAGAWNLGDIVWDRHYHVTLLSDSHLRGLLVDLGLDDEIEWVDTRTGCFAEGELLSVSNTIEFLRFPLLRFADRLRLGWTVWYASRIRDWERLEGIGVEEWLTRVSGGRAFDSFWRPLLRSKLGDDYRRASAAFIWAVIQRLYAARRSGLKRERFGYVPGGYARVLERLRGSLEDVGVEVRLGSRVEAVAAEPAPNVRDASGTEGFDRVVVTVPAPAASRLVTDLPPEDRDRLAGIDYQGVVCASLLLDRPLSPFYVTNITDAGFPFTGVIEMTALVDPAVFGDRHLVYVPRYLDGGDPFFDRPEGEIRRDFVAGLTRMHPGFSESNVLAFRLSRVRHVMPVPTLGYSKRLPRQDLLPGVTIVNSSHIVNGTLNVNETVGLAEDTARRLLGPSHERPGEEPS